MIELKTQEIAGAQPGLHLLITGGVHGDEFESIASIHRLMKLLEPAGLRGRVTLVPIVNESAFFRGKRTAEDELDLARTCPGDPKGSITEQIAHAVSALIRTADFYIDLHTGGTEMSVLPLAGYNLHPNPNVLDHQRAMAKTFNLPTIWGTHPGLDGRTLSIARDANIPAIYTEYLGGARCSPEGVDDYVNGCLNVMGYLKMIDRQQPKSVVERVVEDDRPQSGFMQICNPSPASGYFTPCVALGDEISAGDLIGTVTDVMGQIGHELVSQQTGIVLTLQTFSRVHEGAGLAVVLETDP